MSIPKAGPAGDPGHWVCRTNDISIVSKPAQHGGDRTAGESALALQRSLAFCRLDQHRRGKRPGDAGGTICRIDTGQCVALRNHRPRTRNSHPKLDWSEFEHESLKSINLKEIREQRSIEDVEKLALLLIKYKHLLSNGELDFRTNSNVKHDTQCTITTTSDNPKITAKRTRCNA